MKKKIGGGYCEKKFQAILDYVRNNKVVITNLLTIPQEELLKNFFEKIKEKKYSSYISLKGSLGKCLLDINNNENFSHYALFLKEFNIEKEREMIDLFLFYDPELFYFYLDKLESSSHELLQESYSKDFRDFIKGTDFENRFQEQAKTELKIALQNKDLPIFLKIINILDLDPYEFNLKDFGINILDDYSEVAPDDRMKNFQSYFDYKSKIFNFDQESINVEKGNLTIYYRGYFKNEMKLEEFKSLVFGLNDYIKSNKSLIFNRLIYVSREERERMFLDEEKLLDIEYLNVFGKEKFEKANETNEVINLVHGSPSDHVKREKEVFTILAKVILDDDSKMKTLDGDAKNISPGYIQEYAIPIDIEFNDDIERDYDRYKDIIEKIIKAVRELEERYIKLFQKQNTDYKKLAN